MGRLHTLAAGTALLALGVKAQKTYLGCASLDTSAIKGTIELYPQGPDSCLAYCNSVGYSYAGMQAQFCSCWEFAPVATKKYSDNDHMDCSFNCDDPYATQYCGGIDLSTLGFLYSYYAGTANPNALPSSVSIGGGGVTSSRVEVNPPPATSSAGGGVATPPSSSDAGGGNPPASSSGGGPSALPSTSAGEVLPPTSSGEVLPPTSSGAVLPPTSSGQVVPPPASSGPSGSGGPSPSGILTTPGGTGPAPTGPAPTGSVPGGSGTASPSSTGVGGAPIATIVPLVPGQPFTINIAPYLRNLGDQALSWIPSPVWFLYNSNITSFYGTIPLDLPAGPLIITVTAGQPTTGSNGPQRRQVVGTYTFAIELLIVGPGGTPLPTPSLPTLPVGPSTSGVLPSYTNTVYQTITSTITRCPVCKPEVTLFAVPIGTTCITAEVFTTPCEVTYTRTRPDGVVTPMVTTTISKIPYNPDESTIVVKTVDYLTTKYTTTLLIAVTRTVERVLATGAAGPVQPLAPPPPPPPGPPGGPAGPVPGPPAQAAGPVAPPPNGAYGTGAYNGSQGAKPTMPVTAGASADRFVEVFVLLSAIAFGALLML